jgi:hypothetical protein
VKSEAFNNFYLPREAVFREHPACSAIILAVLIDILADSGTNLADNSIFLAEITINLAYLQNYP